MLHYYSYYSQHIKGYEHALKVKVIALCLAQFLSQVMKWFKFNTDTSTCNTQVSEPVIRKIGLVIMCVIFVTSRQNFAGSQENPRRWSVL